jgi:hypothetical protein
LLFGLRHPRLLRLLWNLRLIKFGQFKTPSGEPYIGFQIRLGGRNRFDIPGLNNTLDEIMLDRVIQKWRREYWLEKYQELPN